MLQPRRDLDFAEEALVADAKSQFRMQDLDRDGPLVPEAAREIHRGDAVAAELTLDDVPASQGGCQACGRHRSVGRRRHMLRRCARCAAKPTEQRGHVLNHNDMTSGAPPHHCERLPIRRDVVVCVGLRLDHSVDREQHALAHDSERGALRSAATVSALLPSFTDR